MDKAKKLQLLVLIIIVGLISAVVFHSLNGFLSRGYPYDTFLFRSDDRFMDFFNPLRGSFDLDPYNPARINYIGGYLPFGYLVSFLFSLIHPWILSLALFITFFIAYLIWYITSTLYPHTKTNWGERFNVLVLALFTYPVLFILDRANFDIVVFIFISLFAFFYQRGRLTLATLLLAFPIAMKGYPLVLLTIPLLDKRIRDIVLTGALAVTLELISLAVFANGLVIEFSKMLTSFGSAYSIAFESGSLVRFNSSLYTFLLFLKPSLIETTWFGRVYMFVMLIAFAFVTTVMYWKNYPFWRKLLLIVLMMILFPQSSGDYRLIMLYPPLLAFLAYEEKNAYDKFITFLLALMLIPKAYYVFYADVNIGIVLNPIILIILLVAITFPIPKIYNAVPN